MEKSMYNRFYGNLYGIGVNAILYKKGDEERKIELKDVAVQADFSKIPEEAAFESYFAVVRNIFYAGVA